MGDPVGHGMGQDMETEHLAGGIYNPLGSCGDPVGHGMGQDMEI